MSSVAEPQPATQPQADFAKAPTPTDATMLVAGSMLGSGILGALASDAPASISRHAATHRTLRRVRSSPRMAVPFGATRHVASRTGSMAVVAFGRFRGVLWPATSPERYGSSLPADACLAALGCTLPGAAIQLPAPGVALMAAIERTPRPTTTCSLPPVGSSIHRFRRGAHGAPATDARP